MFKPGSVHELASVGDDAQLMFWDARAVRLQGMDAGAAVRSWWGQARLHKHVAWGARVHQEGGSGGKADAWQQVARCKRSVGI